MGEWREVTLGDLVSLQRGHDLPKRKMKNGNIPVAGSNGIIGYHDVATTKGVGVTIGRSGNIGNAYLYKNDFWAHNTTLYVKDFNGNDELFSFYFLKNIDFKSFNVGSAVPTLNRNHIHPIEITLPPLPEQKAIAEVLSSLDDKIDLLYRQNKTLEQMAETLFRQWFVEEAGEDWDEKPLSEFLDFREGPGIRNWQYVEDSGVNFINIRLINNNGIDITKANQISKDEAFGKYAHFLLEEKDMVVSTSGTLGKSAIIRKHHLPLCLNTSVIRFRPADKLNYSFMYQYLKSPIFIEQLETMASGSVQLNFGPTHLKRIFLQKPPNKNLTKYRLQADGIYEKIEYNQTQVRTLEFLRDTLLPKLMSGEVRIASHG